MLILLLFPFFLILVAFALLAVYIVRDDARLRELRERDMDRMPCFHDDPLPTGVVPAYKKKDILEHEKDI